MLNNHRELIAHDGPAFVHWRKRTLAAFGILDLDTAEREA